MDSKDEEVFIDFVTKQNDIFINTRNQPIDSIEISASDDLSFYIATSQSKINLSKNGFVDSITSDVIQFSRGFKKEQQLTHGRLWYEPKYYNAEQVLVSKEKWLQEKFMQYRQWIKKKIRESKCKDFYIGEGAYQQYKNNELQMMSTPNMSVQFD